MPKDGLLTFALALFLFGGKSVLKEGYCPILFIVLSACIGAAVF